jgi:outer membrane protein OmpA-like peptidoglycan-associated protein
VLFDPNSSLLGKAAQTTLDDVAAVLIDNPGASISLTGHSASVGPTQGFSQVSAARAMAVKTYLVEAGVEEGRIAVNGVGDTLPTCEDWDAEGGTQTSCAASERRVDLVVTGLTGCE